ncbi:pirin family protein [Corynebacterium breve]|uniref:Pirin family protein n=1 Tax=Corynebacterium breve TaxID=3049799 RepID=A0ABY8VCF2_9CORY|nr:pirin family protein [Corynebacterium breve]WIM67168.1 pirin family protein [Corynebacterium breve]
MTVPVEIITSRAVPLGGPRGMTVHRTLPQRQRSLIGAWCFADHYGPDDVSVTGGMDVAPHPHTGLQTVSWLFEGNITHHDSGGNHAVVVPGEVNLMTAGSGICHSEVTTQDTTTLHGVQLWTVLPDDARHGPRLFENHAPNRVRREGAEILTFVGTLAGETSPVTVFTPMVGAEITLDPSSSVTLEVDATFEHGLLVDSGEITFEDVAVQPTELAYTGVGADALTITNTAPHAAKLILIGGTPFEEEIVMWWNFIGRNSGEVESYREEWQSQSERFGKTLGYIGHDPQGRPWLPAPRFPIIAVKPRENPAPVARPELRIN